MPATQIRGANAGVGTSQIRAATISDADIHASAAIALTKLSEAVIQADGGQAFTAAQSMGGFALTNLPSTPSGANDAASKTYVDNVAQGLAPKQAVRVVATSNITLSGTQTIDGVSLSVGDTVLCIAQSTASQNGSYTVASGAWTRTPDFADANDAVRGPYWFVTEGTANGGNGYICTNTVPYTIGVTALTFTQFTGAGEIIAGNGIQKSGNTLSIDTNVTVDKNTAQTLTNKTIDASQLVGTIAAARMPALTGDVTSTVNTVATTIANGAVSLAKMANLAANSVIGNATGSSATPTAVSMVSTATASAVAIRDGNANVQANNFIENVTTTATAAGTTTLTIASSKFQQFTGSTTQTLVMPNATTLVNGHQFIVANRSSGNVTVNMNGGSLLQTMAGGTLAIFTLINNGTAAGTWDTAYFAAGGGGSVTTVSVVSANGFAGTVANASTTPAITLTTTITGILKGNGTAISAAVAGTDYLSPSGIASNYIVKETPSGTVNGSNTGFTLLNTPVANTEMLFLNGILLEAGGNDYTISGASITMTVAPQTNDKLRATYFK